MLPQESYEKEEQSRMEFFAYFVIAVLMLLTAVVTFLLSRSLSCG